MIVPHTTDFYRSLNEYLNYILTITMRNKGRATKGIMVCPRPLAT